MRKGVKLQFDENLPHELKPGKYLVLLPPSASEAGQALSLEVKEDNLSCIVYDSLLERPYTCAQQDLNTPLLVSSEMACKHKRTLLCQALAQQHAVVGALL